MNGKKATLPQKELKNILTENEPDANVAVSVALCFVAVFYLVIWVLFGIGYLEGASVYSDIALLGGAGLLALSGIVCVIFRGNMKCFRYILCGLLTISVFAVNLISGMKGWLLFAVPIIVSARYFNVGFTATISGISEVLTIASAFINAFLSAKLGVLDLNTVGFATPIALPVEKSLHEALKLMPPDSDILLQNTLRMVTLPNLMILLLITVCCLLLIKVAQNTMYRMYIVSRENAQMQLEMTEARSKVMLSQIGPHFLYNTLSAIMAIEGNPDETVDALGQFSRYLRENLNVLSTSGCIPFQQEMEHVKRYLTLEKLRFGDKVNVAYHLDATEFFIPPLTVQMLAENAVKHGISQMKQGGLLTIASCENKDTYLITVTDNGVGFDTAKPIDRNEHVGLANTRSRLQHFLNAALEVESTPGKGTQITIRIPKNEFLQKGSDKP